MFNRLFWFATLSLGAVIMGDRAMAIEPDYPCYLRTRSGQVVNLGALCSGSTSIVPPEVLAPAIPSSLPASLPRVSQSRLIKGREGREAQKSGTYFNYEVWTDSSNSFAELRYWTDGETPRIYSREFKTAQEAVDVFECQIIGKDTAACPGIVVRPTTTPQSPSGSSSGSFNTPGRTSTP